MAIRTIDVKNTIGIEQGTITTTGTDSDPSRVHQIGFLALEYVGSPPSSLVISVSTSTGKTLNVSYVVYNTADYMDISYDPNAWLTNPCAADLSGKSNVHYIATFARNNDNSNISPSDITAWTITYDDGIVYHAHEGEYPINDSAKPIAQMDFTRPFPLNLWRIDESNDSYPHTDLQPGTQTDFTRPFPLNRWRIDQSNDGYPYTDLQLGILTYEPQPPPPEPTNPERANWLGHWFIRLNDIDRDKTSVMGYISRKSDRAFKPINFKNISNWNKSLQDLNDSYYQMLGDDILGGLIPWEYND